MFQPAGVKTLRLLRSPLPTRPSTQEEATRPTNGYDFEEPHRPPTAPPVLGSRMIDFVDKASHPSTRRQQQENVELERSEDLGSFLEPTEDCTGLLREAASVLQQLQTGWAQERQSEINQLWSQCEAEYGFALSQNVPGTPALGSLRARGGSGAGLFSAGAAEEPNVEDPLVNREVCVSLAEVEADTATEAARIDLKAVQERRRLIEERLAGAPLQAASASQALAQRAACQAGAEADSPRLASLRMEVEKLRAQASAHSHASLSSPRPGDARSEADATVPLPPTPTATAASRAADLVAPELNANALDVWMEDLRVLGNEACQDVRTPRCVGPRQERVQAVASPMRVRNATGSRSPQTLPSPNSSPSKQEMVRVAERRALDWASGLTPRSKSGQQSPSRRTPKESLLSARGGLLGGTPPRPLELTLASKESASAVERQIDDILNELDEIDRIHDDVCMLAHS